MAAPVLLLLMLACMQISHIWLARQVAHYSAFAAARAGLVCKSGEFDDAAKQAAEQVCAWVVIGQSAGEDAKLIPGWGAIPGSGAIERKTRVKTSLAEPKSATATVEFDFALLMPIAGPAIGWLVNPWRQGNEWLEQQADPTGNRHRMQDTMQYPHLLFRESVQLPKPYKTLVGSDLPAGGR